VHTKIIHLSAPGRERLSAELNELVWVRRPQVTERLHRVRELSEGDTNECEDARADQALVEGRIRELEMLLASARCMADGNPGDRIELGSSVTVAALDLDESLNTYRIVKSVEANSRRGLVSDESPLGVRPKSECDNVTAAELRSMDWPRGAMHIAGYFSAGPSRPGTAGSVCRRGRDDSSAGRCLPRAHLLPLAEYSEQPSREHHWCRRIGLHAPARSYLSSTPHQIATRHIAFEEEFVMTWRETEAYLSVASLDGETAELLDVIDTELPFGRARDGNVTAWVLRAEHARVITAGDRALILAGVRTAREKYQLARVGSAHAA
jgi:transcription elongation factor GreA